MLRRDVSVADELDLGDMRDVFDSGVEDYGACGGGGVVVVAVGGLSWVEGLDMKGWLEEVGLDGDIRNQFTHPRQR